MKVLLYSNWTYDFVDFILYDGLHRAIGNKNLFSYVPKHGKMPQYIKGNSSTKTPVLNYVYEEDIINQMDKFDLIIMLSSSVLNSDFNSVINKKTSSLKIFVDGTDDFFVRRIYKHPEIDYYFKREIYDHITTPAAIEWLVRYSYEQFKISRHLTNRRWFSKWNFPIGISLSKKFSKLKPFPLTVLKPSAQTDKNKGTNQFMFVGTYNNPERKRYVETALNILKHSKIKNYYVGQRNKSFSNNDYFNMLKNSRIGLSLRGTGYDTYRYWEIPAHSAALLSQRLPLVIPNDFVDEESALYFSNVEELKRKMYKYLIKTDEWRTIAKNGNKLYLKYHTPENRVKKLILDRCNK